MEESLEQVTISDGKVFLTRQTTTAEMSMNGSVPESVQPLSRGLSNGGACSDFEILSNPSSAAQTPVSLTHVNPMGMSSGPSSMTDITLEQALARVHDLSKENAELRDYLKENNEMMKRQFDTLAQWKQKVHDANVANREKFDQTKALIIGLRKDNEELTEQLQELERAKQERENELLTRLRTAETGKAMNEQVAMSLRRQAEEHGMSVTEPQITVQEMVLVASAEKEEKIQTLEREIEESHQKIEELQENISRREVEVKQFRDSTDQLLKDLEATQKLKEQIQNENQTLNEENLELRQRLQGFLAESKHSIQLLEKVQNSADLNVSNITLVESMLSGKAEAEPAEVTELTEKLQQAERDYSAQIGMLKSQLQDEQVKIQQLQSRIQSMEQEQAITGQRHEQEVAMLNKQYDQKLTEFARQQDIDKEEQLQSAASTYDGDIQSLRSQVLTLISEVHETQIKLAAATDAIDRKDTRIRDFETKNRKLIEEQERHRRESDKLVMSLQAALVSGEQNMLQERQEHENTKRQMNDLRVSFNQLVDDYKELLDTFDQFKYQQDHETKGSKQDTNTKQLSEEINRLTAQVMAAEENMIAREDQIRQLKEENERLMNEFSNMEVVLKAQAEVYKLDFDAERQSRERQVAEKEKIIEEMNSLQVQNQQLLEELDGYSRRQISEMQKRVGPYSFRHSFSPSHMSGGPLPPHGYNYPAQSIAQSPPEQMSGAVFAETMHPPTIGQILKQKPQPLSRGSEPSQHEEEELILYCPKCNLVCPDIDTLQIHVLDCIEQNK